MFWKKKKTPGLRLKTFYPMYRIFHFINHMFKPNQNNTIILARRFYREVGYFPNIEKPQTLNEKILWLTQHYCNPLTRICADKYLVKDYIKQELGEDLCVPTLAVYKSVYDIDLNKLPEKFVLKVNWGWGGKQVIIVKDKSKANIDEIRMKIDDWIQPWNNFFYISYDWGYKNMKPVIYAEEYIEDLDGQLNDYKVYCFNGKVKMILVIGQRFSTSKTTKTFLDPQWNILPVKRPKCAVNEHIQMPKFLDKMLAISEKLAKPFPLLRLDFYIANDKLYIGEMTFHPGSGFEVFEPREWDLKLGTCLELPHPIPEYK